MFTKNLSNVDRFSPQTRQQSSNYAIRLEDSQQQYYFIKMGYREWIHLSVHSTLRFSPNFHLSGNQGNIRIIGLYIIYVIVYLC